MKHFCIFALFALLASTAGASTPGVLGEWITPNGSTVSIYQCDSGVCARLVAISSLVPSRFDEENPNPKQRSRPLCGLEIGYGFHLTKPDHAEGGHLYDPDSGNTYSGWMTSTGNTLTLRGYIGISIFGRSETWKRAGTDVPSCQA